MPPSCTCPSFWIENPSLYVLETHLTLIATFFSKTVEPEEVNNDQRLLSQKTFFLTKKNNYKSKLWPTRINLSFWWNDSLVLITSPLLLQMMMKNSDQISHSSLIFLESCLVSSNFRGSCPISILRTLCNIW